MTPGKFIQIILLSVLVTIGIYIASVLRVGEREIGAMENIDGIPFPVLDGVVQVEEKLAHADVYLTEPVFAKQLVLRITFDPGNVEKLSVGVRDSAFWLDYKKQSLFDGSLSRGAESYGSVPITKAVVIPLTDKFQEPDRSVDLMFFAATAERTSSADEGVDDTVSWKLHGIRASVRPVWPGKAETKDYVRSILKRERVE